MEYKEIKINLNREIPDDYTGVVLDRLETKFWYKKGELHKEDGPAVEYIDGTKAWSLEDYFYTESLFKHLTETGLVIGIEKGQYNLNWIKFLTEKGIQEFPIIHGMDFINADNIR